MLPNRLDSLRDVDFEITSTTTDRRIYLEVLQQCSSVIELRRKIDVEEFETLQNDLRSRRSQISDDDSEVSDAKEESKANLHTL